MFKIAVFVSGRGTNFLALYKSLKTSKKAKIIAVVADKPCLAIGKAEELGISTYFVSNKPVSGFFSFEEINEILKRKEVDLIVLAGFLKKIPDFFVDSFQNKIINIHPALLPAYGGKGMYGMNVHKAVFNAKEKFSGATVHLVDKIYDHGKILAQEKINISNAKSPEEIAEMVLKIEHRILPQTVEKIIDGKLLLTE